MDLGKALARAPVFPERAGSPPVYIAGTSGIVFANIEIILLPENPSHDITSTAGGKLSLLNPWTDKVVERETKTGEKITFTP